MIKNRKAFIVGIKSTVLSKKEKIFLKKHKPWGIILFSRNIFSVKQVQKLVQSIKNIFKDPNYPILTDEEGGTVRRLYKFLDNSVVCSIERNLPQISTCPSGISQSLRFWVPT